LGSAKINKKEGGWPEWPHGGGENRPGKKRENECLRGKDQGGSGRKSAEPGKKKDANAMLLWAERETGKTVTGPQRGQGGDQLEGHKKIKEEKRVKEVKTFIRIREKAGKKKKETAAKEREGKGDYQGKSPNTRHQRPPRN